MRIWCVGFYTQRTFQMKVLLPHSTIAWHASQVCAELAWKTSSAAAAAGMHLEFNVQYNIECMANAAQSGCVWIWLSKFVLPVASVQMHSTLRHIELEHNLYKIGFDGNIYLLGLDRARDFTHSLSWSNLKDVIESMFCFRGCWESNLRIGYHLYVISYMCEWGVYSRCVWTYLF